MKQLDAHFAMVLLAFASVVIPGGCRESKAKPLPSESRVSDTVSEIDVGVVFCDRASCLCLPLSRFGVSDRLDVKTISSSCDCVRPSLVRYRSSSTESADGVWLDFIPECADSVVAPEPKRLGIELTVTMVDDRTRTITVNFLQSAGVGDTLSGDDVP